MSTDNNSVTPASREKIIVRASVVGIGANIVLVVFKAIIGFLTNSIAVILDAVNNLTDALSSIITIIGARVAGRKPDKKHPMGHGRFEYVTQTAVAAIVLYAGITALVESVKKIFKPADVDYSTVSLIIIAVAVAVKIVLGLYMRKKGAEAKSGSLTASGKDALFDAVLSLSVLISAVIFITTGVSLEAYVGVVISVFIIKSGIEMIIDAVHLMIGMRPPPELSKGIKATIAKEPEVYGVYDLIINDYGPEKCVASAHIEVDDTMTAKELDTLTRRIQNSVFTEHNAIMAAVGVYARNTGENEAARIRDRVTEIAMDHEGVLQTHGFYLDEATKTISLDVVIDFAVKDRKELFEHITRDIQSELPDYKIIVARDDDLSD